MVDNMVLIFFILETTYKNSFLGPAPTVCQAKITL
jgi:hypothetical protein